MWADVEDFRREDREQSRRSAKQNREEIEKLCAQQLGLRHQKSNSDSEILADRQLGEDGR